MARRLIVGLALLAAVALGVSIWRFNVARDAGPTLSGDARAGFVRSVIDGCLTTQKASPDNADVPAATIASYCDCYGDALAARVSAADLDRLRGRSPQEIQSEMRPRMEQSEEACFDRLEKR